MSAFQCNVFQQNVFQNDCAPITDEHHGGLLLNPPPGWRAVGSTRAHHGPLNPRAVLTHIDFTRDDPDELWLLELTDLETN